MSRRARPHARHPDPLDRVVHAASDPVSVGARRHPTPAAPLPANCAERHGPQHGRRQHPQGAVQILPGQGEGAPLLPPLLEPEFGRLGKFAGSLGPVPPVFGPAVPVFAVVDDVADGSFPKSPACAAGTPCTTRCPRRRVRAWARTDPADACRSTPRATRGRAYRARGTDRRAGEPGVKPTATGPANRARGRGPRNVPANCSQ